MANKGWNRKQADCKIFGATANNRTYKAFSDGVFGTESIWGFNILICKKKGLIWGCKEGEKERSLLLLFEQVTWTVIAYKEEEEIEHKNIQAAHVFNNLNHIDQVWIL